MFEVRDSLSIESSSDMLCDQSHPEAFNLSDFVSLTMHTHNRVTSSRRKGLKAVSWAAQDMEPRLVLLSRGPELYSTRRLATEAERKDGW